jgi:hypothetical protein
MICIATLGRSLAQPLHRNNGRPYGTHRPTRFTTAALRCTALPAPAPDQCNMHPYTNTPAPVWHSVSNSGWSHLHTARLLPGIMRPRRCTPLSVTDPGRRLAIPRCSCRGFIPQKWSPACATGVCGPWQAARSAGPEGGNDRGAAYGNPAVVGEGRPVSSSEPKARKA